MSIPSLPIAFAAGVLSFLSPCILPLVPIYIAILAGASTTSQVSRQLTFFRVLSFIAGFSLVFTGLGASAGLIGAVAPAGLLERIAGALLLVFGLFLLASIRFHRLNYELHFGRFPGRAGYLHSFLVGAAFSLGWTPCVGPILGGILALASGSQTVWQGMYLLAAYSLGLGAPFLLFGLAIGSATPVTRWLSRRGSAISALSGLLLMGVGVGMLTNAFARFSF